MPIKNKLNWLVSMNINCFCVQNLLPTQYIMYWHIVIYDFNHAMTNQTVFVEPNLLPFIFVPQIKGRKNSWKCICHVVVVFVFVIVVVVVVVVVASLFDAKTLKT